jgi:transcription elongation GreA/GreB family factor
MIEKRHLVDQLCARLRASAIAAEKAGEIAAQEARDGATPAEKREDARVVLEFSSLARGQTQRAERARADLSELESFHPQNLAANAAIELGAVVEVEDEDGGRTFFLAPAGAGEELSGPDGDGFLSVVTPASPVGRAVLGRYRGETIEVSVKGEIREWTITFVG